MAATATIANITTLEDGRVQIQYGGEGKIFMDLADIKRQLNQLQNTDTARMLLIAWWLARHPAGDSTNSVVGKTLVFDISAANPITVK